ncbi:zinc finger protein ZOP1-like isoform X1 [Nicotiana tabacum]|uniref:WW domain-binding protein 4-like isoform X1 n=2 Tax=Nicotiana TaxID=4085 RepID=A0A1S4C107_TOBAC|nr:PREDICTED: WW domain-binding protein 4 [Nicotiana sylvestris]XP_016494840.1 PREDICTED: WW domain-binding protein 4-like isoform X1 [Nicotiana tabacum]
MTEFWVSQGNKWCDFCKIFISNNPTSIRNHDLGTRHKENVANRLSTMRQEKAAKDKDLKEAARALEQIEAKAQRSYQKDMARVKEARSTNIQALVTHDNGQTSAKGSAVSEEWEYDSSSGYYYNQSNGCHYDPNSGFYYTDVLGRWVTQEEALAATQVSSTSAPKKPLGKAPVSMMSAGSSENKSTEAPQSGPPPGRVVSTPPNPMRSVKGKPSSLTVSKRKRENEKPKVVTEEEAAARKAREAAKKRVEEREKSLLGLYKH